jgi:hypothetical protein
VLFRSCKFGDGDCDQPVASHEDVPYCNLHTKIPKDLDTSNASLSESPMKVIYTAVLVIISVSLSFV